MADKLITERVGKNGNVSYLVRIREAGVKANKTFKTIKEAEKFIREVKTKIDKGESVDIAKIKKLTLTAIFDEYLKHNVVARGKKYTVEKLKLELGAVPCQPSRLVTLPFTSMPSGSRKFLTRRKEEGTPLFKGNMVKDEETGKMVKKIYAEGPFAKSTM